MENTAKRKLQKIGGISALVSAASYLFAIGLLMTMMTPLTDPTLEFSDYMDFLTAHQHMVFIWNFLLYIVHGATLVILALAFFDRVKDDSPLLARIGTGFGLIWTGLVLLSGFICVSGTDALIKLYQTNPAQAETFKTMLNNINFGIDISDKFLGSLWVGLISLAAWKKRRFPLYANIIGLALSGAALVMGLILPINNTAGSLTFGLGVLIWWTITGIIMLRKPEETDG